MSGHLTIELPDAMLDALADLAAERVLARLSETRPPQSPSSPYMTIPEAAAYLRCERQRIDDLLSQRKLSRVKDGGRTLVSGAEIEQHLKRHPRRSDW